MKFMPNETEIKILETKIGVVILNIIIKNIALFWDKRIKSERKVFNKPIFPIKKVMEKVVVKVINIIGT